MRFSKMHGIGNDYIYVDVAREKVSDPAALARAVSDRHIGIGGDGLILVGAASARSNAHASMRMFNADGSESQMCGNGIRCVTKFVVDRGICDENPLRIETGRGVLEMEWWVGSDGRVCDVEVDMGAPILSAKAIGVRWPGINDDSQIVACPWTDVMWRDAMIAVSSAEETTPDLKWLKFAGVKSTASVVSMGNPHIVFWCEDVAKVPLESIGTAIERHAFFPQRINVHFVQLLSRGELRMRTWERGSGITLACGTGASAVCVAGVLEGRSDRTVRIHLPGGELSLRWDETDGRVRMRGPAVHVFDGVWDEAKSSVMHATQ
ncbi:MAG: diaminopimelate epimerase [Planctomycetota bacterium]|nr:diaminopimelate epimerase [Planctomycetota bacterium]